MHTQHSLNIAIHLKPHHVYINFQSMPCFMRVSVHICDFDSLRTQADKDAIFPARIQFRGIEGGVGVKYVRVGTAAWKVLMRASRQRSTAASVSRFPPHIFWFSAIF
jgi:hypothetical protein